MAEARIPGVLPTCAALQSWHGAIEGKRDIAREAFEETIRYLRVEFQGQEDELAWLGTLTSVEDIHKTLKESQDKAQREGKSTIRLWFEKLSSVVMYYSGALDTLAQQHPEYLSLVWGMLKFILMAISNRAELGVELAKAMVDIAEVLPRAKLDAELYQTDHTRAVISTLYAHILLFFKQTISWFNLSRTRKIMSAILNPFKLGLKTTVDEVKRCAMILDIVADSASKAEIRSMHVLMQAVFKELENMRTKFDVLSTSLDAKLEVVAWGKPILEDIHLNVRDMKPRIIDIQSHQTMVLLKPQIPPLDALRKQQNIARRSQPWMSTNMDISNLVTRICDWIFSSKSSLLILEAPMRAETKAKEIAIELIGLLQATDKRVSWYLSTTTCVDNDVTIVDILKSLVYQLICFDPENIHRLLDGNLTAMKLQQEHSQREWAELLNTILKHLSDCFIVIEAEDFYKLMEQKASYMGSLLSILRPLTARASDEGLRIKILLVGYCKSSNHGIASSTQEPFVHTVPLQPAVPIPTARLRNGTKSAFQSPMWLNMRHRVMKEQ